MNKDNINIHIGQVIHTYRKMRQLTLADLSQQMDISYQQLQKYEKGTNRISADKLFHLANLLKANPVEFFPGFCEISEVEDNQRKKIIHIVSNIEDDRLKNTLLNFLERLYHLHIKEKIDYL